MLADRPPVARCRGFAHRPAIVATVAAVLALASIPTVPAADPDRAQLAVRIAQLVEGLDSDKFDVRRRAAEELDGLANREDLAPVLAAEFRRLLDTRTRSFEVRTQLEAWLKRLPKPPDTAEPPEVSDADLQQLVERLDADSYAERLTATRRLESLGSQATLAPRVMESLKGRLAEPKLSSDLQSRLTPLWERARGAWLASDPATWKLPPVADTDIEKAVADLDRPAPKDFQLTTWPEHAAARRTLLDLLARDDCLDRTKRALESRLINADEDSRARLQEVLEWTHPALVAEIWQGRQHIAIQHLLVDVPRQSLGAIRPSHFSRIDDRTAQCVSGSNLVPGEYPVGVSVAHPERPGWTCHLVNLPTARRRLAYEYAVRVDERQRLAELTERTIRRYTTEKLYLRELEMIGLQELDPATVSRHIGAYFLAVDDQRLDPSGYNLGGINASHHNRLAYLVAQMGTREIAPGLLTALAKDRFLAPTVTTSPYRWPWIAALCVAARDPWSGVEPWLAGLIDRAEPLVVGRAIDEEEPTPGSQRAIAAAAPPDLGAVAAAILLQRHDVTPTTYGLETVESAVLRNLSCPSYRFDSAESRQRVRQWWQERLRMATEKSATP